MAERPEPLYPTIPTDWLSRTGLLGFQPTGNSYVMGPNEHPDMPAGQLVPLSEIRPPVRDPGVPYLVEHRALSIMEAVAKGAPLPPVVLYAVAEGTYRYRLGAGLHRFSRALGFSAIPATILDYWEPWMTGDPMP